MVFRHQRENLLAQRKATGTFDMVGGKMQFLPNGTVTMPLQLNEVADGSAKVVKAVLGGK